MSKSKSFVSILIPSATVFFSSGCIMVLELVAGRLIARHLGSSLYTWTSVIGVVLAGITIGNYLGGRIADRSNRGAGTIPAPAPYRGKSLGTRRVIGATQEELYWTLAPEEGLSDASAACSSSPKEVRRERRTAKPSSVRATQKTPWTSVPSATASSGVTPRGSRASLQAA